MPVLTVASGVQSIDVVIGIDAVPAEAALCRVSEDVPTDVLTGKDPQANLFPTAGALENEKQVGLNATTVHVQVQGVDGGKVLDNATDAALDNVLAGVDKGPGLEQQLDKAGIQTANAQAGQVMHLSSTAGGAPGVVTAPVAAVGAEQIMTTTSVAAGHGGADEVLQLEQVSKNPTILDTKLSDIPASTVFARMYTATAACLKTAADRAINSNNLDVVKHVPGPSGTQSEVVALECAATGSQVSAGVEHDARGILKTVADNEILDRVTQIFWI